MYLMQVIHDITTVAVPMPPKEVVDIIIRYIPPSRWHVVARLSKTWCDRISNSHKKWLLGLVEELSHRVYFARDIGSTKYPNDVLVYVSDHVTFPLIPCDVDRFRGSCEIISLCIITLQLRHHWKKWEERGETLEPQDSVIGVFSTIVNETYPELFTDMRHMGFCKDIVQTNHSHNLLVTAIAKLVRKALLLDIQDVEDELDLSVGRRILEERTIIVLYESMDCEYTRTMLAECKKKLAELAEKIPLLEDAYRLRKW
jgi:hypothetical protein